MTDDLTTRLLAAIDRAEQNALLATQPGQWAAAAGWRPIVRAQVVGLDGKTHFDSVTRAILIRCAVDRKIVERYTNAVAAKRTYDEIDWSAMPERGAREQAYASGAESALLMTLVDLAEGYGLTAEPAP